MKTRIPFLITLLCAAFASVQLVHAATITVTNTNDSGAGSLRQALVDASNLDTINFAVTGTITSSNLVVDKSVTISGPGANLLTVDGNHVYTVFYVASGQSVTITGLSIINGLSPQAGGIGGGGIYNDHATLTVANCTLSGNTNFVSGCLGGAIFNNGFQGTATLIVKNSTFSGNGGGGYGGGIASDGATLIVNNCTFSSNLSFPGGSGGIASITESVGDRATVIVNNSTFNGNTGAIDNFTSGCTVSISNTILNAGATTPPNITNSGGAVVSAGYNLSSDDGGGYLTGPGDRINTDPMLGPLQDNGGPTFTYLPLTGSPAIDAGPESLSLDQRGFLRVVNGRIDIGAVEVQTAPTPVAPTGLDATNKTASSFTANWSSVSGATGYRLDVSTSSSFVSYVAGYQNLDVGNVTTQSVTGLASSTFYYYRLRAYNGTGTSPNSNVVTVKTKTR